MKHLPGYFYPTLSQYSQFLIYALLDPVTLEIRHIGKSCSGFQRIRQHFRCSQLKSKTKKNNWIKSLMLNKVYPGVVILCEAQDKIALSQLEIEQISKHKSDKLLNMTRGGDGYGYTVSKRKTAWNRDKPATESAKAAMSNARLGRKFKPRTIEERIKISNSNINSHRGETKPFICLQNSKIYRSQREAAIELNLNPANISGVLNGHKKTTGGYSFKFI